MVPLSCLANKMIHSRILCKPPRELRVNSAVRRVWRRAPLRARVLRSRTVLRAASDGFQWARRRTPMSLVGQRVARTLLPARLLVFGMSTDDRSFADARLAVDQRARCLGGTGICSYRQRWSRPSSCRPQASLFWSDPALWRAGPHRRCDCAVGWGRSMRLGYRRRCGRIRAPRRAVRLMVASRSGNPGRMPGEKRGSFQYVTDLAVASSPDERPAVSSVRP